MSSFARTVLPSVTARLRAPLRPATSRAQVLLDQHLEVEPQLVVELAIERAAAPEIGEAAEARHGESGVLQDAADGARQCRPVRFFVGEAAPAGGGDGVEPRAAVVLGHPPGST